MIFFATTPKGLELLLVEELRALGAETAAEKLAGVVFTGDLSIAYKACLWSRLANRILLPIAQFPATTPEELYAGIQTIFWDEHLDAKASLHIHFVSSQSEITHTLYGAQKVKDAIVDQFRHKYNARPNVSKINPDISIHVYLHKNIANISIDLSGESLHRRNIRIEQGAAPLKENLASAILLRSGWKSVVQAGGTLIDPMCGSGTFLIEAAQIAGNIAPGLTREYYGFLGWKKHDKQCWQRLISEAKTQQTLDLIPEIIGYDIDPKAIKIAFANIERAGMLGKIHVEKCELSNLVVKNHLMPGLVVINPPYGERLGEESDLKRLYQSIGTQLKLQFSGWKAGIFTGNPELGKTMGLRARKHYALYNGAIPCQLLLFDVESQWFIDRSPEAHNERRIQRAQRTLDDADVHAIQMFINRLTKNYKHLTRWAAREKITNFRIYDADLPEYAVTIDQYDHAIVIKEYPAPKSIDKTKAERRLHHVLAALPEALYVSSKNIFFHDYKTQAALARMDDCFDLKDFYHAKEDDLIFLTNLQHVNIETGLPLHQRLLRRYIQQQAHGKHFLNVFSRSGTMTVAAVKGGALSTLSVDSSEFFLEWTHQNLMINSLNSSKHKYMFADPFEWIMKEKNRFNLIYAELPESAHRIREDYQKFISMLIQLLQPKGQLILTSRDQRYKFDLTSDNDFLVEVLTQKLIPEDFKKQVRMCQTIHLLRK